MPSLAEMVSGRGAEPNKAGKLQALLKLHQEQMGLHDAVTANPMMQRQFAKARGLLTAPGLMDDRYPAWKKTQDQADQFLLGADALGAVMPLAGPAVRGAASLGKALAPKAADMAEGYMARTGMLQPMTAWHGSPHKFDKFDASKIGTGEGAQAYGHGLYFAESPDVASTYMAGKSGFVAEPLIGGRPVHELPKELLRKWEMNSGGTSYGMLDELRKVSDPADTLAYYKKGGGPLAEIAKEMESMGVKNARANHLYKVDIPDEQVAKMLDWDKPLSQQPEAIQNLFAGVDRLKDPYIRSKVTTGEAYGELSGLMGGREKATEYLRSNGIPGIRYLDGDSRAGGTGTSNFVVFPGNEGLLKILDRK